jgi:3',5'-cyclic AMP phosphodiesterase CpdA
VIQARALGLAGLTWLAMLAASPAARAYSPCEDVSVAGQPIAPNPTGGLPATVVCNAELATVSDDSAVVTWVTNRVSPSNVAWWDVTGQSTGAASGADGIYHYVEITGLKPATIYYYQIEADAGVPATPTLQSPGIFRTFDSSRLCSSPPCAPRFRFASLNDMHVGENVSGQATALPNSLPPPLAGQPIPPSFRQDSPHYWQVMNEGAVADIKKHNPAFTILKGDITAEGGNPGVDLSGDQFVLARQILDGLGGPYFAVRGNHDKRADLEKSLVFDYGVANLPPTLTVTATNVVPGYDADGHPVGDPHFDFAFSYTPAPGQTVRFIALDTWDNDHPPAGPATSAGRFTADQLTFLDEQLSTDTTSPTFIYMHHPVSEVASETAVPPIVFGVRQPDAALFLGKVRTHANVVGVLSAHTHRNWITPSALAPGVPFVETAASKEYPGGYTIYKVFEKGYIQSFYKCSTEACLEWSEETRGEYLNLYPLYTSQTGARSGSFAYDFRTREIFFAELP